MAVESYLDGNDVPGSPATAGEPNTEIFTSVGTIIDPLDEMIMILQQCAQSVDSGSLDLPARADDCHVEHLTRHVLLAAAT
ncbi:hypothetical protein ACWDD9_22365 [Kitasatospora sp. NPDC001119]